MRRQVLIFFIIISLMMLNACGGFKRIDALRAIDFFTGSEVTIPLSFRYGVPAGYHTSIACKYTVNELADRIRMLSSDEVSYMVTEYPSSLLISIKTDKEASLLLLNKMYNWEVTKKQPYSYVFFSPHVGIKDVNARIAFPLHLINEESLRHYLHNIEPGKKYRTDYGMEDFLDFYKSLGDYILNWIQKIFRSLIIVLLLTPIILEA